jgi:hypothetical protein
MDASHEVDKAAIQRSMELVRRDILEAAEAVVRGKLEVSWITRRRP